MKNNSIWVLSKAAAELIRQKLLGEQHSRRVVTVSGNEYSEYKANLIGLQNEKKGERLCIFDAAVLEGERKWAFVKDGINRAGSNPLRELGTSPGKQFIDVSNLYHVPEGEEGIVITSLGEGFKEGAAIGGNKCSAMQSLAIIAHDLDFMVFGVVLSVEEKWDIRDRLFCDLGVKYNL